MSSADSGLPANRERTHQPQPQVVPGEDAVLSPDDVRCLLGTNGRSTTPRSVWDSLFPWRMQRDYREQQDSMALYPKILREEKSTWRQLYAFDVLVYACLVLQLVIASTLVILSAVSGDHHIVVAVLGAITALITGVLSLVKGLGQPMRLLNYADSLEKVRDDIEFCERELQTSSPVVTYKRVLDIWNKYISARNSKMKNRPDVWASQERDTRTS
ncbi:hypothetical protein ANOM_011495 [Aspergillus nomiae NRRL 13137]|uniref:SMODS and SLOG-associating 2TM effector domain-containing protein n=1 Tax=Aspergillus nomiae NRRL (strain ATCC 15546 / NRRL 13137 / CBS 260.88 / M93) TaxID=1509407 RepID=A0A0L1IM67_ASPN3|nr:uncharacterized protein ANOM_011495 [Aspergillus nomiae NRRL 13137]KNG80370.1 hypothetical protein ANOM_011495 [Aspergillus nomiae NRRL 13137]